MTPNSNNQQPLTFAKAQGLNRAERRRLGAINGVKIPGITKPTIKWQKRERHDYEGKGPKVKIKI